MSVIHTRALILRHSTEREHDRLVTVLTPGHGQLRIRARGTKKSTSKLAGSLEPVTEVDLSLANGRVIDQVIGSVMVNRYPQLHDDLVGLASAQWLLELVEALTKPALPTAGLYDLVLTFLSDMSRETELRPAQRWLLLLHRACLLLQHEGFMPGWETCGRCRQSLNGEVSYESQHGFVHRLEALPGSRSLSDSTVAFLQRLQWPNVERPMVLELHAVVESAIHHTIDQPLKSEQVLRSIMRLELPRADEKS